MRISFDQLQPLGRALMLPIAVLPVAGLLLRLGQPDLLNIAFIADSGGAIFSNLGLIFAIGVAVGLAHENHGAAALAGAIVFLVTIEGAKSFLSIPLDVSQTWTADTNSTLGAAWREKEIARLSVPAGIVSGLTAGALYNRFFNIVLPEYLAFFGGRRFVPIVAGFAGLFGAVIFGAGFPVLAHGIDAFSVWVVGAGPVGLFLYGVINRLLIVTGLHHILNNIAWFIVGEFDGKTGDLNRFFAGDPSAGSFMAGFFPIMIFGLPAACLAMYHAASPERRKAVGGMFLSLGLTSFLTGVTEPIEFAFIFVAPLLYAVHAALTGISMVIMDMLNVKLGFGFSAGLFDYLINFKLATRPLLLIPVGLAYSAVYYVAFRWCIKRFDLKTPGRDAETHREVETAVDSDRALGFINALGGKSNLLSINACMTRLRLKVVDISVIDEHSLKTLGSRGVVKLGDGAIQVVVGPIADAIASEMRASIRTANEELPAPIVATHHQRNPMAPHQMAAIVAALGGGANISDVLEKGGRVRAIVNDWTLVDQAALQKCTSNRWARVKENLVHILV